MNGAHSAPWGGKGWKSACHSAAQVVVGVPMAAGKLRASRPENGLDTSRGRALRQQRTRDPEIHDTPVRLWKASGDVPSPHPGLVDLAGLLCGDRHGIAAVQSSVGAGAGQRAVRPWRGLLRRGTQQAVGTTRQTRATMDDFHPRSGAARRTPLGLLIGETGESAQVPPVGAGPVSSISPGQMPTDNSSDSRLQWSGTDMHPGLQMTGTGLEHCAGFMPVGLHVREDHRIGMVQVDQHVAGVLVCGIGLHVNVTALAVAHAQESEGRQIHQLGRGPQPFAGERPLGDGVNQTNQIQFVGHGRKLAADSMPGEGESTVEHGPHFAIQPGCRTINSQWAVSSVLTDRLSPGVHPRLR
jgi:hypothetical protein